LIFSPNFPNLKDNPYVFLWYWFWRLSISKCGPGGRFFTFVLPVLAFASHSWIGPRSFSHRFVSLPLDRCIFSVPSTFLLCCHIGIFCGPLTPQPTESGFFAGGLKTPPRVSSKIGTHAISSGPVSPFFAAALVFYLLRLTTPPFRLGHVQQWFLDCCSPFLRPPY